jgi:amino acid transporter
MSTESAVAPEPRSVASPAVAAGDRTDLRKNSVGLAGVVGQSLSAMGLSGVIGTSVPVVAITAGAGGWVSWGIASLIVLPVALSMSLLARRYSTSGGLYGLTAKALGPLAGLVTGGLMVCLVGVAAGLGVLSFGVYFSQFLSHFDVSYSPVILGVTSVGCLAVTWWLARIGAKPAAWVMFVTEVTATVAMLVVFVAVLIAHPGDWFDTRQLQLDGTSTTAIVSAVVLAVGGFGGFESAAVYGKESTNPHRAIPIAMVMSSLIAGAIWMFSGYVLYLGFQFSDTTVKQSPAPMGTLADVAGISWYSYVVDLALSFTIGASLIAIFSWVARFMYTMSTEGVAPKAWQRIHRKYQTPTTALTHAGIVWLVLVVGMTCISDNPLATFGDFIGDLSGYPLLLVYALVAAAAVRYQWQRGARWSIWTLVGVLGVAGMAFTLYENFVPFPGWPTDLVIALFLGTTVAICAIYEMLRRRHSPVLAQIGTSVDEGGTSDRA